MDKNKEYVDKIDNVLKQMEQSKAPSFKLIINDDFSIYNCIAYLQNNEKQAKCVYFGYALENCFSDNIAVSIVKFFVDAIANPQKLNFMRFDQEPGLIQISVVDEKVYITEVPEGSILEARLTTNKNEIIKNSDVVDMNVYACARQIINDIEENMTVITKNFDNKMKLHFNRYFETLKQLSQAK